MTAANPSLTPRGNSARRFIGFLSFAAILGFLLAACSNTRDSTVEPLTPSEPLSHVVPVSAADPPTTGKPKETLVDGKRLFSDWPANQKPDAVIVFTGQTFGYLQPCGCSRPQTGGLERRAMLIASLKAKGWPVAGVDLGDVAPDKPPEQQKVWLDEQAKLKYVATMNSLREMGYLAVGIGRTELQGDLIALLAAYSLQKEQRPFTLASNTVGVVQGKPVPRSQYFPAPPGSTRPLVEMVEVGNVGEVPVGVAGVVGSAFREENQKQKWATDIDFTDTKKAIGEAEAALGNHPLKPELNVLIFQGPKNDVVKAAGDFSKFQLIICQSDSDLAPLKPQTVVGKKGEKTLIIQVGHKGQHVGVLGAFKKPNGGFDFAYQLVPLGEEYITPGTDAEALQKNKTLESLETYGKAVKAENFLPKYPRVAHPEQIRAAGLKPPVNNLSYVGTDACKGCHAAEFKVWQNHPHSHAVETLEKVAKRPSLRQFDGECMQCHTVGFHYKTGYVDEKTTKHLRDVGCESCHGPGSGHVAAPNRKDLLELMSPWKQAGAAKLPDAQFMKKMADTPAPERGQTAIAPAQQLLIRMVEGRCMKCHDPEADPHFDLYKAWQKVDHTGLARPGGLPVVPPK